jgi:nitroreductase
VGIGAGERALLPESARGFLEVMERRWACKLFDESSPVGRELEEYLLECGRLSPSSFGIEPWKFLAVREAALRRSLREASLGQDAVGTAPLVIVILVRREAAYSLDSAFLKARAERFPGGWELFKADYEGYYRFLSSTGSLEHWARAQSYIPCANMMSAAAAAGLDSCAIEGFEEEQVLRALAIDGLEWRVGIIVSFGRAAEPRRERVREEIEALVERR